MKYARLERERRYLLAEVDRRFSGGALASLSSPDLHDLLAEYGLR
jgi:hypothetical protein